jgi:hypothetical protein
MQAGIDKWEAAGFLAISVEILERVYGHHHSQHPRKAANALNCWPRKILAGPSAVRRSVKAPSRKLFNNVGGERSPRTTCLHSGISREQGSAGQP